MPKKAFTYEYERPALTSDCVVFGLDEDNLKLLLIQRDIEPFEGSWALPGGFIHMGESIDDCARRELSEEAGLTDIYLEQLYTYGEPNRDPREQVVTVAYFALVNRIEHKPVADTDARNAAWFDLDNLPELAFDHKDIVNKAKERLRGKLRYEPIGFELLPSKFTLTQLQRLYEIILETEIDKRNFRKKILKLDLLIETDEVEQDVARRAAKLYKFDKKKYLKLAKQGIHFEV